MSHIDTVKQIYCAFALGDIATVLDQLAENVDWNNQGTAGHELPWHGNFSGRRNVAKFFAAIAANIDIPVFLPLNFLETGNHVAVRLHLEMVVKRNGTKIAYDSIHFWTFDAAGKVCGYRHFNDTAAELQAWHGKPIRAAA